MPARAHISDERGTVTIVAAFLMMAMVGMLALVVDVGYAYAQRRLAQNVADSAALAGTMVVAHQWEDGSRSDADVASAVSGTAQRSSGAFSGHYTAVYVDQSGSQVGTVGAGAIPSGALGVRVSPAKSFSTFFAPAIGVRSLSTGASATGQAFSVVGFDQSSPDYAPYAIWVGEPRYQCADGTYRCHLITDTSGNATPPVVFRDNSYQNVNVSKGNPNWSGNSNTFKGFLHQGSGYIDINAWSNGDGSTNQGGNAFGSEPLAMLQTHFAAGTVVVLPIVDREQGNGSNTQFHVAGFVALRITQLDTQGSGQFKGQMVAGPFTSGAIAGGTPVPGTQTLLYTKLVQ